MSDEEPSDFEVMRSALLRMDPETRAEVIEAMKAIRALPTHIAVRVLANAAMDEAIKRRPILLLPG